MTNQYAIDVTTDQYLFDSTTDRYIFDVDGTLTPSRGKINSLFKADFIKFCMNHSVYLVTGSDRPKTIEQIGHDTYYWCNLVYQCSGNDVWSGDENIETKQFVWPNGLNEFCDYWISYSSYHTRTGHHKDVRPGLLNLSIVGRNATQEQRVDYAKYDQQHKEREHIARLVNEKFPGYEAIVAGETSIDITPVGSGKEQIVNKFSLDDKLIFFGDRMAPEGNDYKLAMEVASLGGDVYHVKDWKQTWEVIKQLL